MMCTFEMARTKEPMFESRALHFKCYIRKKGIGKQADQQTKQTHYPHSVVGSLPD